MFLEVCYTSCLGTTSMSLKQGRLSLSFIIPSMANLGIPPMHCYLKYSCFPFVYLPVLRAQHEIWIPRSAQKLVCNTILKAAPWGFCIYGVPHRRCRCSKLNWTDLLHSNLKLCFNMHLKHYDCVNNYWENSVLIHFTFSVGIFAVIYFCSEANEEWNPYIVLLVLRPKLGAY